MSRPLFVVLLLAGLCFSSCSASEPGRPPPLRDMMRTGDVVVLAETVNVSEGGEVTIRPLVWFAGTLPVDADGLYRFEWDKVGSYTTGLWNFDNGQPVWSAEFERDPNVPRYPWSIHHNSIVATTLYGTFPEATRLEVTRVLAEATLLVEIVRDPDDSDSSEGYRGCVVRVLDGDGVEVDELLEIWPANADEYPIDPGVAYSPLVALQRDGDIFVEVPTWMGRGWETTLAEDIVYVLRDLFPGYETTYDDVTPSNFNCVE